MSYYRNLARRVRRLQELRGASTIAISIGDGRICHIKHNELLDVFIASMDRHYRAVVGEPQPQSQYDAVLDLLAHAKPSEKAEPMVNLTISMLQHPTYPELRRGTGEVEGDGVLG